MTTILFIGDPHIQVSNIQEVDAFIERVIYIIKHKVPDRIVVAGDLLHTHERLHTVALNRAYDFVRQLRDITHTYVLVGNHDYIQNQQFLTENHWMNAMKEWDNVTIVDTVLHETINGELFVFVPYVPNGRFEEALQTIGDTWKQASCIFAHQEFEGCKMGAIVSVEGDKWSDMYPHVVSGHIHSRQRIQSNIYYTGSAMQHAFGESEKNIIAYLHFKHKVYDTEEIDLCLPRKKIIYMNVEDFDTFRIPNDTDSFRLTITGLYEQFKLLKKSEKYRHFIRKGLKIVFKPSKLVIHTDYMVADGTDVSFSVILDKLIHETDNAHLVDIYESVVKSKSK